MKLFRTLVIGALFALAVSVYIYQSRLDQEILSLNPDEVNRSFTLGPDQHVDRIAIHDTVKNTEIVLERTGEGWRVESPVSYPADSRTVEGLVLAVRFAASQTRLRAEKDWTEYGLDQPGLELRIETRAKREGVLFFGDSSPIGKALYARWSGERGYILVPPEIKSIFNASVYALRDKSIFRILPEEMVKVYVEMGPNAYEWKREGGRWFWMEPIEKFGREIAEERMQLVFKGLAGLHVMEFLDDNRKSDAELGFFIIHDKIKITRDSGEEEIFYFGNEVPLKNSYYGKMGKNGMVVLVDRMKIIQFLDLMKALELDPADRAVSNHPEGRSISG